MTSATVARLLAAARQAPVSLANYHPAPAPAAALPPIFRAILHSPLTHPTGLIGLLRQTQIACSSSGN